MSKNTRLRDRSALLQQARQFFTQRGVVEVDCPILSASASIDAHIDLIPAQYKGSEKVYLHSSPEFGMKRLLAEGLGDIFQLSHVFRDGEHGHKHNPEFMMAEWYRLGISLEQMMEETVEFIRLFLGPLPWSIVSYREAFQRYTGLDYWKLDRKQLFEYIQKAGIPSYPSLVNEDRDSLLNLILANQIEPQLGQNDLTVLAYYPASQAALAQKRWHDSEQVSERFEIYYKGLELANGYHELADPIEQRERFKESNLHRQQLGKNTLPIDENFLHALKKGLPECCGVAVGFDRLMMLRHKTNNIADVLSWGWTES